MTETRLVLVKIRSFMGILRWISDVHCHSMMKRGLTRSALKTAITSTNPNCWNWCPIVKHGKPWKWQFCVGYKVYLLTDLQYNDECSFVSIVSCMNHSHLIHFSFSLVTYRRLQSICFSFRSSTTFFLSFYAYHLHRWAFRATSTKHDST